MVEVPFFSLSLEMLVSFLKQVNYEKNIKGLKWIFYTKLRNLTKSKDYAGNLDTRW